jgi:hypothetical protein
MVEVDRLESFWTRRKLRNKVTIMRIEFQLIGRGDNYPEWMDSPVVPQKGDEIEYLRTIYRVKCIRFLIEKNATRTIAVIELVENDK